VDLGYGRVSTAKQDLERQVDALMAAGIPEKLIYLERSRGRRRTGRGCGQRWHTPARVT